MVSNLALVFLKSIKQIKKQNVLNSFAKNALDLIEKKKLKPINHLMLIPFISFPLPENLIRKVH